MNLNLQQLSLGEFHSQAARPAISAWPLQAAALCGIIHDSEQLIPVAETRS